MEEGIPFGLLVFPEEDGRRKYGLGRVRLMRVLERVLGVGEGVLGGGGRGERGDGDEEEDEEEDEEDGNGWCLGLEVERVLKAKQCQSETECSSLTIAQIDELLDELSSTSTFTHSTILNKYPTHRSKFDILKSLYRPLSPFESKFITQIILKDLHPLLYPSLNDIGYSKELMEYNTKSVRMLRVEDVMRVWDSTGWMGRVWRVRGEMEDVVKEFEECGEDEKLRERVLKPKLGSMIKLPKSVKGRNCYHALSYFKKSTMVWGETKYDGERAQIHVEILEDDGTSNIRIWSKSGRESTWDRLGVHEIIRDALGLNKSGKSRVSSNRVTTARVKRNVVLDAEMVAWYKDHVDEFWRIRGLVEQTASGPRRRTKRQRNDFDSQDEDGDSQSRHLALIFFDVLVLDDEPLLFESYATRRQHLESLIKVIPTKAMLSDRYPIQMSPSSLILQKIFAEHLANHMEGLVLKAEESQYNEYGLPWVKLKKDYIEGFGDCVDLVIVGASWNRDRARELRVTPNVFTTFFVGVITNRKECQLQPDLKPHILVYFTVSYGLSRKDLEDVNFRIKNSDNVLYPPSTKELNGLPFTFTLSSHLDCKPKTILHIPFLAEMVFAGFDKSYGCKYYEPRFPRITKIHDKRERSWSTCMDITELDKIARECVGKDRSEKEIDDWCKSLWGLPTSPTIGMKRQMRVDDILEKLVDVEGGLGDARRGESELKRRKLDFRRMEDGLSLNRAVVYSQPGDPTQVLKVISLPSSYLSSSPPPGTINIRFLLSPINPADINVIEGVYPTKPSKTEDGYYIGGNEGLARVTAVGGNSGNNGNLKVGDWVVMQRQQMGTWSMERNVEIGDVIKIPNRKGISEVDGATITVNPPTAFNMLKDYAKLEEGDWVMQNGANSAVGQAVIQIAAARNLKTLNFVRNRDDISQLKEQLSSLGATQVLTYDDLEDRALRSKVKEWTNGKDIRLALNCVGGKETTAMLKYLGKEAHLVSYGAMSKQPLSLPTSAFIFKNLTAHGFWQSRWYTDRPGEEREDLMESLTQLIRGGKLQAPQHEVVTVEKKDDDDTATNKLRQVFGRLAQGRYGKKVLLKFGE
ncbi:hypothetical protein AGABI1DRAFT_119018 [Agaricus bisporus var. burnettii JB137-S8]|uniref:enoyl-[acyl-carrier-protein] reductase n=1 Tax=Agaricus bisporus var. burnettii (strain JB137-S8 / ATCC MYA-4627 / FGSC 10392) TaxID=597362 RepID=K5XFI5_AGABU|nr:uncharacterized protein AGABI1DRAFT_119018 [Agaricus bisporus var. burnettii JB137-S8]EKM81997.1 hypothetical protein AGABI1DRAFT_119018 [Agaricus bisporus var. burnettii JB137-S8]